MFVALSFIACVFFISDFGAFRVFHIIAMLIRQTIDKFELKSFLDRVRLWRSSLPGQGSGVAISMATAYNTVYGATNTVHGTTNTDVGVGIGLLRGESTNELERP